MSKPRDERHRDLFRPALDEIIDLGHPLARLAREIDWGFLDARFGSVYRAGPGQPPLPTRLVAGLFILKHMHDLSDEVLCARWLENPYYQYFRGEESFCHKRPFDRSSLSRWRRRLGEEQLTALLAESLSVAHGTGALGTKDLERVAVDTTVQPKTIAFPTDARLLHKAIVMLGKQARQHGVAPRQSHVRVAKRAALMAGRYSHAKQFKRYKGRLRFLRTRLGRLSRDIRRKTAHDAALRQALAIPLARADRIARQKQRQRGWKLYSWHAPEVECIGKGKAKAPYEFGCKVSVATPVTKPKGGQFVLHAKALHGNPDDGLDEGDILLQKEVEVGPDDTLGTVYFQKIFQLGVDSMLESVDLIKAGNAPRIPQDHSKATYESWCRKADAEIDWSKPLDRVYDLIRGTNPQPGAWTTLNGATLQVFDCEKQPGEAGGVPGAVVAVGAAGIAVACDGGRVLVKRVRPEGAGKMPAADLAENASLTLGTVLGA